MKMQFDARVVAFEKQEDLCDSAQWDLGHKTEDCKVVAHNSTIQNNTCGTKFSEIESFSCDWATGFTSRCSTDNTCYAGVLVR